MWRYHKQLHSKCPEEYRTGIEWWIPAWWLSKQTLTGCHVAFLAVTPCLMGNSSSYLVCFTVDQCIPETLRSMLWAYLICSSSGFLTTTTMEHFGLLYGFFKDSSCHRGTTQVVHPRKSPSPALGSAQGNNTHFFRECFPLRLVLEHGKRDKSSLVFLVEFAGRNTRFGMSGGDSARKILFVYQKLES